MERRCWENGIIVPSSIQVPIDISRKIVCRQSLFIDTIRTWQGRLASTSIFTLRALADLEAFRDDDDFDHPSEIFMPAYTRIGESEFEVDLILDFCRMNFPSMIKFDDQQVAEPDEDSDSDDEYPTGEFYPIGGMDRVVFNSRSAGYHWAYPEMRVTHRRQWLLQNIGA